MEDDDDNEKKEDWAESFDQLKGNLHILDQKVPVETQMAFFKLSERERKKNDPPRPLSDEICLQNYAVLNLETTSVAEKKQILVLLATSKSVKAFRLLNEYVKHADPLVLNWTYMALMESQIFLESDFTDEQQVYISTGLGGKNGKLRFCALLLATDNVPFKDYQRKLIEQEIQFEFNEEKWEVEKVNVAENYVEVLFLVPFHAAIKDVFDRLVSGCNQYGDFLSSVYNITNVKEFSSEEIQKAIHKNGNRKASN